MKKPITDNGSHLTYKGEVYNQYGVKPRKWAPINNPKKLKEPEESFNKIRGEKQNESVCDQG